MYSCIQIATGNKLDPSKSDLMSANVNFNNFGLPRRLRLLHVVGISVSAMQCIFLILDILNIIVSIWILMACMFVIRCPFRAKGTNLVRLLTLSQFGRLGNRTRL